MGGEWGPEQRKTATAHFLGTGCGQLCGARTAGAGREQGRGETATPLPLTHVNSKHQFWGRGKCRRTEPMVSTPCQLNINAEALISHCRGGGGGGGAEGAGPDSHLPASVPASVTSSPAISPVPQSTLPQMRNLARTSIQLICFTFYFTTAPSP